MNIRKKINLQFPDSFFKEEVICDYLVTEKLKRIWAVEIDLLNELLRVCKKHDIRVTVFAGTLLGAVRHKGMIPWDDDIDVCLTREEYEKLIAVAESEFKHPYFFQTALTDRKFYIDFARLRNSLTTGLILSDMSEDYNNGIYIDIFVVDGYIDNKFLLKKQLLLRGLYGHLLSSYTMNINNNVGIKKAVKRAFYLFINHTFCRIVGYETVVKWASHNLSRYNSKTNRLSIMHSAEKFYSKYWLLKEDIDNIIFLDFAGIKVPAPSSYHEILSHTYGNYMEFPPVEKRGQWHQGSLEFEPDIPYVEYIKNRNKKE